MGLPGRDEGATRCLHAHFRLRERTAIYEELLSDLDDRGCGEICQMTGKNYLLEKEEASRPVNPICVHKELP